jgi:phage terminase large subunit
VAYGVDWGHNNPAVIVAVVRTGDEWTVAGEWYERRCTVQDHSRAAEDMVEKWGAGPIYCDPSEPANIEQFRRDGLAAKKADNSVTPGIQHVASLADRLRVARHCQNIRNEFSQYQYKDGGDGDTPLKQHDHALDALRYALFTHTPNTQSSDESGLSYL